MPEQKKLLLSLHILWGQLLLNCRKASALFLTVQE